jgi:hypothetical protein
LIYLLAFFLFFCATCPQIRNDTVTVKIMESLYAERIDYVAMAGVEKVLSTYFYLLMSFHHYGIFFGGIPFKNKIARKKVVLQKV